MTPNAILPGPCPASPTFKRLSHFVRPAGPSSGPRCTGPLHHLGWLQLCVRLGEHLRTPMALARLEAELDAGSEALLASEDYASERRGPQRRRGRCFAAAARAGRAGGDARGAGLARDGGSSGAWGGAGDDERSPRCGAAGRARADPQRGGDVRHACSSCGRRRWASTCTRRSAGSGATRPTRGWRRSGRGWPSCGRIASWRRRWRARSASRARTGRPAWSTARARGWRGRVDASASCGRRSRRRRRG
jgi:hypothetical protein